MIDLQELSSREEVAEKLLQGQREISVLFKAASQAFGSFLAMFFGCVGSLNLLVHVVDSQRHDGEPINSAARRFRVHRSVRQRLDAVLAEQFDDRGVEFFDMVVPLLIQAVDTSLDPGDFLIGNIGTPSDIFFVPEIVIPTMLFAGQFQKIGSEIVVKLLSMPKVDRFPMKIGNRFNTKHFSKG